MIGKYRIITLCGSTKFKDAFLEQQKRLTLEGNIVISVGLFGHAGDEEVWTPGTKEILDDMHKRRLILQTAYLSLMSMATSANRPDPRLNMQKSMDGSTLSRCRNPLFHKPSSFRPPHVRDRLPPVSG